MNEITKEVAEKNTILRVVAGSQAYGTNLSDGDRDEKGIFIEPMEYSVGFHPIDMFKYRSAEEREGHKDAKSQPGDLDLELFSLRKFLRLALNGNPNVIEQLFIKKYVNCTALGSRVQDLAPYLVAKKTCGNAYLGYMHAQSMRMKAGEGSAHGDRMEVVAKYGYDTQYGAHILRLGYQGIELMATGRLTFPIPEVARAAIIAVKKGEVSFPDMLAAAGQIERQLKDAVADSNLRETPDEKAVEDWMISNYWNWWKALRYIAEMKDNYDQTVH